MPRRFLARFMPTQEQLRRGGGLRFIGERVFDPEVWHVSRRSVRMATLVGVTSCWIPLPMQMPLACVLSIGLRCNLPMAAALCWISNPLTLPAMVYLAYKCGMVLLGRPPLELPDDLSAGVLLEQLGAIGLPFLLGSLVCGIVTGLAAAMAMDLIWRFAVLRRWRRRLHGHGEDAWRHGFRDRLLQRTARASTGIDDGLAGAESVTRDAIPRADPLPPHGGPGTQPPRY